MLTSSNRKHHIDQKFDLSEIGVDYKNCYFLRLVAKGRRFEKVDFKYTIFDACYLRDCVFDSCDFTGCRFVGTNFHGTSFAGCKFDYAIFEKTIIDSDILNNGFPGYENLKLKLARTLRLNFQQIGDSGAVNRAIEVELGATEVYLKKAWSSNESYYRNKYKGWHRVKLFFEWRVFRSLDLIWGNGESPLKLSRAVFIFLIMMTLGDAICFKDAFKLQSYWEAFVQAPQIFLGTLTPVNYSPLVISLIVLIRLIAIAFFISIIIKRLNRR